MARAIILKAGQVFGRLTVVSRADSVKGALMWNCTCSCGGVKAVIGASLVSGRAKSCGCLREQGKFAISHGLSGDNRTSEYGTWQAMRARCNNPSHIDYSSYGGRGITVCPTWDDFTVFLKDMGERPRGLSLDRKDNNKGYFKDNCHWATSLEQVDNRRVTKFVEYQGEKISVSEFSKRIGVDTGVVSGRLRLNWSLEKISTTPVRPRSKWVFITPSKEN